MSKILRQTQQGTSRLLRSFSHLVLMLPQRCPSSSELLYFMVWVWGLGSRRRYSVLLHLMEWRHKSLEARPHTALKLHPCSTCEANHQAGAIVMSRPIFLLLVGWGRGGIVVWPIRAFLTTGGKGIYPITVQEEVSMISPRLSCHTTCVLVSVNVGVTNAQISGAFEALEGRVPTTVCLLATSSHP